MDTRKANEAFEEARRLFEEKNYDRAITLLDALDAAFPGNHRLISARARTLEKLGRYSEAKRLCERLLNEHNYEKIRPLYNHLVAIHNSVEIPASLTDAGVDAGLENWSAGDTEIRKRQEAPEPKRFRLPLKRLLLLGVLAAGLYWLKAPLWLLAVLCGLYAALFLILPFLVKKILFRLFSTPFIMKGKALAGAQATVHGIYPAEKPPKAEGEDDEEDKTKEPVDYYWIDVTVTPADPKGPFTLWEPGELAFLPQGKRLKTLDDFEHCHTVHEVRVLTGDVEAAWDGEKYPGPLRLKLLAGLPVNYEEFELVYYLERIGHLRLPD